MIAIGCRYVVGGVFLMAAVSKIVNSRDFEAQVLLHSSLPQVLASVMPARQVQLSFSLARVVVAVLPWLELSCGLCLIFRWGLREAAVIISLLLSLFIAHSLAYRSEDCQCFFFPTIASSMPWWWHPIRDGLLLICSVYLVWRGLPEKIESR